MHSRSSAVESVGAETRPHASTGKFRSILQPLVAMTKRPALDAKARKALIRKYGKLHAALTVLFAKADPIGIGIPATSNEYDLEVGTVLPRLKSCASPSDVQRVLYEEFAHWFTPDTAGTADSYRVLAGEVWVLMAQYPMTTGQSDNAASS